MDDAEDRSARSDAYREREHSDRRVQRGATKGARAIAGILPEFVPEVLSTHLILDIVSEGTTFVAHRGKVTKAMKRGLPRFVRGKSFMLQPPDEHLDVIGQLVIDLVVNRWLPEEPGAGAEQLSHRALTPV
jgi:hypothetical protein